MPSPAASLRETVHLELMTSMMAFSPALSLSQLISCSRTAFVVDSGDITVAPNLFHHHRHNHHHQPILWAAGWPLPLFSNCSCPTLFISILCHQISLSHPPLSYCSSAASSPIFQYPMYYPGGSPVVSSLHYICFCYSAWCSLGIWLPATSLLAQCCDQLTERPRLLTG